MQNFASAVFFLVLVGLISAHQVPSFPGQNAQKPPEVHHQGQMHQQPPPAHQDTPPQNVREFGGEQVKNVEHIKEHLDGKLDPTANMTPEQLQFHYFNMHDADKNGLLDGLELIKAITHFHDDISENRDSGQGASQTPQVLTEMEIERMLDPIFDSDDLNRDGFISYPEFSKAQKQRDEQMRQEYQQQQQQQQQKPSHH